MATEEVEEEEYLVHVEFDSILDCDAFKKSDLFFKVIGIGSDKPVMQIEDQVFIGQYRDIPGTSLFFEEDNTQGTDDTVFAKTAENPLKYKYKTRKSLLMKRVFIKKKDLSSVNNCTQDDCEVVDSTGAVSQHVLEAESIVAAELGMEISGMRINEESHSVKDDVGEQNKQEAISESSEHSQGKSTVTSSKCNIEPVAGPSWAPDVLPNDCDEMIGDLPTSSANEEEMSRMIAEQITLESDIQMQHSSNK